jgi:hypothetical protein
VRLEDEPFLLGDVLLDQLLDVRRAGRISIQPVGAQQVEADLRPVEPGKNASRTGNHRLEMLLRAERHVSVGIREVSRLAICSASRIPCSTSSRNALG